MYNVLAHVHTHYTNLVWDVGGVPGCAIGN